MENFEGKIINISGDRKTLKIQNNESSKTFRSFNPVGKDFSPSDYVKISYYVKEFNDKKFNNIKSMEIMKEESPEEIEESEQVKPKYISDSTINCLIMQSVQLSKDEGQGLDTATNKVLESYKKIIENL